ncbi:peptidylprolyl isomerase [Marinilabiliaceae bacterium JC017]|nr:peptidylprolyl isomerase [Marinilabiliaceae bacterium JC017]
MRCFIYSLLVFAVIACGGEKSNRQASKSPKTYTGSYQSNVKGIVSIQTFDHYTRILKRGYGFYVGTNLVVTNLDLIKGCYRAKISPMDTEDFTEVKGFVAYDFGLNLVLLEVARKNPNALKLSHVPSNPDTIYSLFRKNRKLFVRKASLDSEQKNDTISFQPILSNELIAGKPVFDKRHQLVGINQKRTSKDTILSTALHAKWITKLVKEKMKRPQALFDLSAKSDKVYISHKKVKGFRIKTTMGNIDIHLYDATQKYRDNFIKLVSDQFYDSLLVHRVLENFLIQTGASDTKYAKKDDVVGWQGPGYTLPMNIKPQLFHRRGAVAASKLPRDRNPKNRSDGSQFYIISGRSFSNSELDELEEEKGTKFTKQQRSVYTTTGGAPYLDGDYTVFGEVVRGMAIVDKIAAVETYAVDRPVKDIRVLTIEILTR